MGRLENEIVYVREVEDEPHERSCPDSWCQDWRRISCR